MSQRVGLCSESCLLTIYAAIYRRTNSLNIWLSSSSGESLSCARMWSNRRPQTDAIMCMIHSHLLSVEYITDRKDATRPLLVRQLFRPLNVGTWCVKYILAMMSSDGGCSINVSDGTEYTLLVIHSSISARRKWWRHYVFGLFVRPRASPSVHPSGEQYVA